MEITEMGAQLREFGWFVAERQRIYLKRRAGEKPPWTDHGPLQEHHFCNVYRELDPGTEFMVEHVLRARSGYRMPLHDYVFRVMVYRLFGLESTWTAAFQELELSEDSIWKCFEKLLKHREEGPGGPIYTSAYMVNSYTQMGTSDKLLNILRLCLDLARERANFREKILMAIEDRDRSGLISFLSGIYGWGPFLAYQTVVDLSYPLPEPLAEWEESFTGVGSILGPVIGTNDGYVRPGPGTQKGLERLLGDTRQADATGWIKMLQDYLNEKLEQEKLLLADSKGLHIPLTKANVANCLCEYEKYCAMQDGNKPRLRKFDSVSAYRRDRLALGDGTQLPLPTTTEGPDSVSVRLV